MYLVLKSVPTKECIAHNSLTNTTFTRINDIIHYFQLRIEFTNDYSNFSEHICDCNFKKETDIFEVYSKPYPSNDTNRKIYDKVLKSEFHYSPKNYSFEEYKKNYCKPFELWIRNYHQTQSHINCCPKCAVGRGLLNIGENSVSESLEYYKKAHYLILELPNAEISTIICDLVTYAIHRMHISGRTGQNFTYNFTRTYEQSYSQMQFLDCDLIQRGGGVSNQLKLDTYIDMLLSYQKEKWIQHTYTRFRTLLPDIEKHLHEWKHEVQTTAREIVQIGMESRKDEKKFLYEEHENLIDFG